MMQPSCKILRHRFLVTSIRELVCAIYSPSQWAKCSKTVKPPLKHTGKRKLGTAEQCTVGTESCERLHCFSSWAEGPKPYKWQFMAITTEPWKVQAVRMFEILCWALGKNNSKRAFARKELHFQRPNIYRNTIFFNFKAAIKCVSISAFGEEQCTLQFYNPFRFQEYWNKRKWVSCN